MSTPGSFERFKEARAVNLAAARKRLDHVTDPAWTERLQALIERMSSPAATRLDYLHSRVRQWNKHPHRKLKPMEN